MSISVNGQSQVPPGFRFHPTEEELLDYYLRKKVSYEKIDLDVIRDVDLNKLEPWDIQEMCRIGSTPQNDWYFFSLKDKKYPTGTRTNRATAVGFWKATGRDKVIFSNCRRIGMRKTLVFYKGRAPHGLKSDWIMHEYRLEENTGTDANIVSNVMVETVQEEGWVVCRIFKKKNHLKTLDSPGNESRGSHFRDSGNEGTLEQILHQMGRTCNGVNVEQGRSSLRSIGTGMNNDYFQDMLFKLPGFESPISTSSQICYQSIIPDLTPENKVVIGHHDHQVNGNSKIVTADRNLVYHLDSSGSSAGLTNWAALDRLVASQLNGCQTESSRQLACFSEPNMEGYCCTADEHDHLQLPTLRSSSSPSTTMSSSSSLQRANYINPTMDYDSEIDLWSFARSASSLPNVENVGVTKLN